MLLLFFEQLMNIVINLYLNIWWNSSAKPSVSWIFVFSCYMNLFLNSDFLFLQWIHFSSLCLTKEDIFCSKFFNSLIWTHSLILLTYRNLLGMTIFFNFCVYWFQHIFSFFFVQYKVIQISWSFQRKSLHFLGTFFFVLAFDLLSEILFHVLKNIL